ncbi:hypothetical protein [Micromonospora zamorensis]|uniref:hypothetical protein n=1 Tax=Micromonospora zamorensis TaxID=709883 RepID=UPI00339DFC81
MTAVAAGAFRRTALERADQQVAWARADQAFFAAGACHILAWACRDAYPARSVDVAAVRLAGDPQIFHAYASWNGWAFDHSGWNPEPQLLAVNADFEGHPLERVGIIVDSLNSVRSTTTVCRTSIGATHSPVLAGMLADSPRPGHSYL